MLAHTRLTYTRPRPQVKKAQWELFAKELSVEWDIELSASSVSQQYNKKTPQALKDQLKQQAAPPTCAPRSAANRSLPCLPPRHLIPLAPTRPHPHRPRAPRLNPTATRHRRRRRRSAPPPLPSLPTTPHPMSRYSDAPWTREEDQLMEAHHASVEAGEAGCECAACRADGEGPVKFNWPEFAREKLPGRDPRLASFRAKTIGSKRNNAAHADDEPYAPSAAAPPPAAVLAALNAVTALTPSAWGRVERAAWCTFSVSCTRSDGHV